MNPHQGSLVLRQGNRNGNSASCGSVRHFKLIIQLLECLLVPTWAVKCQVGKKSYAFENMYGSDKEHEPLQLRI